MSVISLDEQRKKRANSLRQELVSPRNIPLEQLGLRPTEEDYNYRQMALILFVLDTAANARLKINSRVARACSMWVGVCASEGWISTATAEDQWGSRWFLTESGLSTRVTLSEMVSYTKGVIDEDIN